MSYSVESINGCTKKLVFNFEGVDLSTQIEEALKDTPHEEHKIREVLNQFNLADYFKDISADDLIAAMF